MANETKKKSTNKTSTKKTSAIKDNSKKSTKSTSSNKTTTRTTAKKTVSSKKNTKQKNTTQKKVNKDLEKTVIIENIENKINDIVKKQEIEAIENIEENIKNVAKLENAKYTIRKNNKNLLAIGVLISILGIVALIITLVANRIVDKEFISDSAITLMVIASIIIEIFGAFIIINES